ncbi:WS/DGAT domain-containing protein [Modestobacter sp. NPDC013298]|uniref:WS/DGAT domain-containing protein n=1 Tax=Modestobacter sp. NPDC013298 TaxID=3155464 RepID=UPI0033CDD65F
MSSCRAPACARRCRWPARPGARLLEAVPIAPLAPGVPLAVSALSYAGELTVSVTSPSSVPDLDELVSGIAAGFDTLARLARSGRRDRSAPPAV